MDYSLLVGIHKCSKNNGKDCSLACAFRDFNNNNHTQNAKFREKRKKKRRKDEKKEQAQPTAEPPKDQHTDTSHSEQESTDPKDEPKPISDSKEVSKEDSTQQASETKEGPVESHQEHPNSEESNTHNNNTQPEETVHSTPSQEALPIDSGEEPSRKFSITSASSRSSKGKERIKESERSDSIPGWLNSLRLKGSGNGTGRKMPSGPKTQTSYPLPEKYK